MKYAYCDCFSGISGDMFLGALVDAGLPVETLREGLGRLNLPEPIEIQVSEVRKGALRATSLDVVVGESHHHRHFTDIAEMIESSSLSDRVKRTSLSIFRILAEAEARVHGTEIEHVHFHEVGALDSIADIIGAAIGLEALGIDRLYASAVPFSGGQVQTQHGTLPVPAPATTTTLPSAPTARCCSPVRTTTPPCGPAAGRGGRPDRTRRRRRLVARRRAASGPPGGWSSSPLPYF